MDFERWFRQQGRQEEAEEELPDGILEIIKRHEDGSLQVLARCCNCGSEWDLDLDSIEDWDPTMPLGCSPHCIP